MNKSWIPYFRTGKHKDSRGIESTWTPAQLDRAVKQFNSLSGVEKLKRPVTISHPDNNLPIMGFIEAVQRIGDTLYALPGKVADGFKELVNAGELPERSISFFSDGTINHFGFLPKGERAAVPNLGTFNFSTEQPEVIVFNFNEGEVAELPSYDDLTKQITLLSAEVQGMKKEPATDATALEQSEYKIKELVTELAQYKSKFETAQFSQSLGNNLTPAQKALIIKLYESIANVAGSKYEFSDKTTETPANLLLELSKLFSSKFDFSEFAKKRVSDLASANPDEQSESQKLAADIRAGM